MLGSPSQANYACANALLDGLVAHRASRGLPATAADFGPWGRGGMASSQAALANLKTGGHLIITTPTFGFPLHRFPKDYWRFGEDAFREVFFAGFEILNLVHLDDDLIPAKNVTIAAIGRKL